ncbi:gamma carbonic anhydrase family protein [Flavobacterium sp. xlx-214]|uniref:gamma carbonic anhydrase family protein n=1 Tax=unclassified Flavobacterium TaxID=196869 RepID=UPI0013CF9F0C|nr:MULTISPECIES: gamma carbonic anhydrase family protein [unclassified Flavobacterium]MBA5792812.1 gamma carbonic anhydrase family protein [Flavobacterium sp. xlx-221]QMI83948.1 gamma carbonic anhydrase family protein [Flavobacterium sp. xlx-214]
MALIKSINGKEPQYPNNCFFAENATVIGDVEMGNECSVWYNAVVRGDVHFIKMGNKVNVQDGAVIHCTYKKHPTIIGNNVSIGHNAIVHGCTIHDNVLVGMGAIIMDNCTVHSNVIIAAGAVVTQNMELLSNGIYAGVPAKRVKELNASDFAGEIERISTNYVLYASWQ